MISKKRDRDRDEKRVLTNDNGTWWSMFSNEFGLSSMRTEQNKHWRNFSILTKWHGSLTCLAIYMKWQCIQRAISDSMYISAQIKYVERSYTKQLLKLCDRVYVCVIDQSSCWFLL